MQIEIVASNNTSDLAFVYTKAIVNAIRQKVDEHNTTAKQKVTFQQLKVLFIEGSASKESTVQVNGFARINMFLRLLEADSIASEFKKLINKRNIETKKSFDISSIISPSTEDFTLASEDVKRFNIDFKLANIEELYFVDYDYKTSFENYL